LLKVNITTLGCPKNLVDSDHLAKSFVSEGFTYVVDANEADILLVNTCGFIRDAKEESIEEVLRLVEIKMGSKKLIVFGCLAKRYRDELLREIPEIDGIWGVSEEDRIIEYCKKLQVTSYKLKTEKRFKKPHWINNEKQLTTFNFQLSTLSYAYLKIADGCDKRCTFCVIPSIKGKFRSFPPEVILKEAEEYIQQGIKELILVAQDITLYGKGLGRYNLISLLKDMVSINGDFRIRILYLYPTEISDELIECVATEDKICKYLDIPLQHSEDRILRLMGRRGTRKEYIKLIRNIRCDIPGIALRTTFIVGFPTETEEDFKGLLDFIEEVRFDRLGVFKYSREEGTPASRLKGHLPERVKNRRFDEIMKRQALISLKKNKELIGREFDAIIDEVDGDLAIARLYSHTPEIDGVVIIQNTVPPAHPSPSMGEGKGGGESLDSGLCALGSVEVGDMVAVKIVDAFDYDLKGVLVK